MGLLVWMGTIKNRRLKFCQRFPGQESWRWLWAGSGIWPWRQLRQPSCQQIELPGAEIKSKLCFWLWECVGSGSSQRGQVPNELKITPFPWLDSFGWLIFMFPDVKKYAMKSFAEVLSSTKIPRVSRGSWCLEQALLLAYSQQGPWAWWTCLTFLAGVYQRETHKWYVVIG